MQLLETTSNGIVEPIVPLVSIDGQVPGSKESSDER